MKQLPLEGVRVLDISQVMAGPFACMLLGDLGADVIKIEPPGTGDQTRGSMGFKMKGADSLGFLNMNRNKRSIALDLKTEAGKSVVLKPGGYHLMLTGLKAPLKQGDLLKLTLVFEKAGAIDLEATVQPIGATGPPGFDAQPKTGSSGSAHKH